MPSQLRRIRSGRNNVFLPQSKILIYYFKHVRRFGEIEVEWAEKTETNVGIALEALQAGTASKAIFWPTTGLETGNLW